MGKWITKKGVHVYLENEEPDLADAIADYYGKNKLPTVYLDKNEFAHVISEINTWYRKDYIRKKMITKEIGSYVYTFENKGYNNYRFIGRDSIEEILDRWEIAKRVKW